MYLGLPCYLPAFLLCPFYPHTPVCLIIVFLCLYLLYVPLQQPRHAYLGPLPGLFTIASLCCACLGATHDLVPSPLCHAPVSLLCLPPHTPGYCWPITDIHPSFSSPHLSL